MKKTFRNGGLAAVLIAVALPSLAFAQSRDAVVEAAKKESGLVWYESLSRDEGEAIMKEFQKVYPFVKKIEFVDAPGSQKTVRLSQEILAGGPTADVTFSSVNVLSEFSKNNQLLAVDWKALGVAESPSNTPTPDMINVSSLLMGIIYNTRRVNEADVPKTWEDVLAPRWKGKTMALEHGGAYPYFLPVWGEAKTTDFVRRFGLLEPKLTRGSYAMVQAVSSGEADMAISMYHTSVEAVAKGAPMNFKFLEPIVVVQQYASAFKLGRNPNTAKLFLAWLNSKEGVLVQEGVSQRGNINTPGTNTAKIIEGHKLSVMNAMDELAFTAKNQQLTKDYGALLRGR